jgi:hypothetical protein
MKGILADRVNYLEGVYGKYAWEQKRPIIDAEEASLSCRSFEASPAVILKLDLEKRSETLERNDESLARECHEWGLAAVQDVTMTQFENAKGLVQCSGIAVLMRYEFDHTPGSLDVND